MYLGSKKILKTKALDKLFVEVKLEKEETQILNKEVFNAIKTKEKIDEGKLQEERRLFIAQKFYEYLYFYNVYLSDIAPILEYVNRTANDAYNKTVNKIWGKGEDEYKDMYDIQAHNS